MRLVCIESPLRGDYPRNVLYADACMSDALGRGEAPFLGHLLYPRVLDDNIDAHRILGIEAHCAWLRAADVVIVYTDLGITEGMRKAISLAQTMKIPVQFRSLGPDWLARIKPSPTPGFNGN
jgi:hypothetical protein